jgi:hypothetical protein
MRAAHNRSHTLPHPSRTVVLTCGFLASISSRLGVGELAEMLAPDGRWRWRWHFTEAEAALVKEDIASRARIVRAPRAPKPALPPDGRERRAAEYAEQLVVEGYSEHDARTRSRAAYGLAKASRSEECADAP